MRAMAPSTPLDVCCHTCHTPPGKPCKARRQGGTFCYMREKHFAAQLGGYTCPVCIGWLRIGEDQNG